MPLLSLVTVADPAADCRSRVPLAASHFLGSFLVPPPPWISSFLPLSGFPVSQAGPLFLCFFIPVNSLPPGLPALDLGGRRQGRGAGEGFLPSPSTSPSPAKPWCFQPYPSPRTFHPSSSSTPHSPNKVILSAQLSCFPQEWVSGRSVPICSPFQSVGLHIFAITLLTRPPAIPSVSGFEGSVSITGWNLQGNLGAVKPGIMCPINARSIPSSKFPVTSGVGTLQPRFLPAPGTQGLRVRAWCFQDIMLLPRNKRNKPQEPGARESLSGTHSLLHTCPLLPVAPRGHCPPCWLPLLCLQQETLKMSCWAAAFFQNDNLPSRHRCSLQG